MSLANIGYAAYLTWGNLTLTQLEKQALVPLFGDSPVEMLADAAPSTPFAALGEDPIYL